MYLNGHRLFNHLSGLNEPGLRTLEVKGNGFTDTMNSLLFPSSSSSPLAEGLSLDLALRAIFCHSFVTYILSILSILSSFSFVLILCLY